MKRKFTFLLMALLALAGFKSWGQETLPYSYGFENNDLTAAGWSTANPGSSNTGTFGIFENAKHDGNYGFQFSSIQWASNYNQYLISPQISASSDFVLQFYYRSPNQSWEIFRVGYSTTDNQLGSFTYWGSISANSSEWTLSEEFHFPAGTKYVVINYYSDYLYYLQVDDFTFTAFNPCPKPKDLAASNITGTGATISWTDNGTESYKLAYGVASTFDLSNPSTYTLKNGLTTTSVQLTGLTNGTEYKCAVKAVCGDEGESDWSQTYSFTPTCPTIAYLYSEGETAATVTLYWGVNGSTDSYALAYGDSESFDIDNPNTYEIVDGITTTTYQLQDLTTGTYKYAVKASCGGSEYGDWSNTMTFTLSCPAPSLNSYNIDFTLTTATISWSSYQNFIESYTLAYGLASTFDLEDPSTYTSVPVEPGEWDTEYEITDLTPNVAYKCAVRSSCDGSTQSAWSNVVTFTPSLKAPESLSISNIMATSVTASWNASDGAANYTVAYGLANGFNLDDPTTYQTTEPTSATSVEINGLTAEQNYACAVKATVDDINSEWSYPAYFVPTAKKTLVANNGTSVSTDGFDGTPFNGYQVANTNVQGQFIIPASELTAMSGSSIVELEFYHNNSYAWYSSYGAWNIYLKEVSNTAVPSSFYNTDSDPDMELVYSGSIDIPNTVLSVTLDTPFEYNGSNLLVCFKETSTEGATNSWTPWLGVYTSEYTSIGYENNYGNVVQNQFLPKTKITYIPMEKFAITLVQPEDEDEVGTIAADMTEAAEGKTVTLSFNPKQYDDHSYKISSWNVTKTGDETVTVEVADNNTFVMPAYPVTVSADIETVTYYALTVDEEIVGGTVEAYPAEHIEFGQQVELNASPAQHYKFVEWNITKVPSGDAFPVPALPYTTFNMPASALNVSATFEAYLPHTITLPEPVEKGYVEASQTEGLYCYDNVTLTVHPAEHCSLQSIVIMAGETPVLYTQDGNNYYFSMPDGDVTVTATFAENSKYNVTLVYDEDGGSITLQGGNTEYYAGDPVNLSVAANTGYILLSLEAEDSEHNPVTITNNQFVMPESAVTVTAVFVHGITVNDGNNTNGYVPINGYNADAYTKSQFIIPESSLVDMKNGKIESMAFYLSDPSDSHTFTGNWKVYIKNVVNATTLSNYETLSAEEKVYEGGIAITNGKMTVNIPEDNQYEYRGGNLLIGFEQTQTGSWHTTNWLGVNQSSYTAYAGYTSWGYDYSEARKFLPKVTFLYEPGEPLPEYDITFHSNGIVSEQTITEGQLLPDPTNIPAGLTFEGWATEDIETYYNEEQAEQIEYVTAARAEEDLYAVFSYGENETTSKGAGTWTKVTDVNELADNDKVVFVYGNLILGQRTGEYNYYFSALSNGLTIVDNVVTNIPDEAVEFTLQSNGDNWHLNYYDKIAEVMTCVAYGSYDVYPASYGWGFSDWTAEQISDAVVFKTSNDTHYIGYNGSAMKVVNSSGNKCNVYKASAPVVTHYYYMTEVLTNGNITADTEVKNIIVNGSITVDQFKTLSLADGGLFRNKTTANFVFNNGAQFYYNGNANATFKKSIDPYDKPTGNDGYYLIANPTDNATVAHLTDNDYDLYTFNPTQALEWHNEKENNTLTSGIGYLYANSDYVTLEFAGNLRSAADDMTIDLAYYDGGEDGHEFPGFNLVGNPFACNAYVYNNAGEDFTYYTIVGSEITATTGATIPCTGIFVEASEANQQVTFSTEAPEAPASLLSLTVSQNRGNAIDRAIVRFDGSSNLHKFMLNPDHTNLSIAKDGETFAAVSSETKGELPVSFKAETTGTYTISVNTENVTAGYIHLIDNMTGTDVDLLATPSYTFIGSPADKENRFTVKFEVSYGQDGDGDEHFAYQNGSELVIDGEGTLQIFDVLGRVVISEEVHGQTVNVGGLNTGAYIVRLTGESVKTQKIVVR